MNNLASRYLGLELAHPIIASASSLTTTVDGMRQLEDANAAAVVMASLYEAQVRAEDINYAMVTEYTAGSHPEAGTYFPELPDYWHGVSGHLDTVRRASEALDIPVIASLCGVSDDGWLDLAIGLEQAGAAALELNLFALPTDFTVPGADIERRYIDIVRHVKSQLKIPIAVKLPPFFSSIGNLVRNLESAGADGVVLFNRVFPADVDLETLSVGRRATLSSPADFHVPLAWTALLSRHFRLSIAAGLGVDSYAEVVKFLLAGADVVSTASALLRYGPEHMTALVAGLSKWLAESPFGSVTEIRGRLDATHIAAAETFLRTQYLHTLTDLALRRASGRMEEVAPV
ncbi:MAG: dihydroorotate dehydrogenase-like protein [Acetobacteraceae bacterium]|nr:dihydroorotate dehydrogenase-like protein [Acetobacteraceae bacterium]MBV8576531.1 dihydroorotate dehydrogenase-like protein [Acetobacteraceae bacterium]